MTKHKGNMCVEQKYVDESCVFIVHICIFYRFACWIQFCLFALRVRGCVSGADFVFLIVFYFNILLFFLSPFDEVHFVSRE